MLQSAVVRISSLFLLVSLDPLVDVLVKVEENEGPPNEIFDIWILRNIACLLLRRVGKWNSHHRDPHRQPHKKCFDLQKTESIACSPDRHSVAHERVPLAIRT
jgi:hypothetical protein